MLYICTKAPAVSTPLIDKQLHLTYTFFDQYSTLVILLEAQLTHTSDITA